MKGGVAGGIKPNMTLCTNSIDRVGPPMAVWRPIARY